MCAVCVSRQIRSDRKEKNAVMSFTVTDEPTFIDLTVSELKEEVGAVVCNQLCPAVSHQVPFRALKKIINLFVFGVCYAKMRFECKFSGVRIL